MSRLRWIVILFVVVTLAGFFYKKAVAQISTGSGWSQPENLSQSATSSSSPTIVADQYGYMHIFWSEGLGMAPHEIGSAPDAGNAIMYRRLESGTWSGAIDVFYGGDASRLDNPVAVVDRNGVLHLVWIQDFSLRYSSVPVGDALKVKSWAHPETLVNGMITQVRMLDLGESILILYNIVIGQDAGLYSFQISGDSLGIPNLVWRGPEGLIPQDIGAALDGKGRVHLVWSVARYPDPSGLEVRYAVSEDSGESWSDSRLIARQTSPDDSLQFAVPWVAARGNDEIHLQWAQGSHAYRRHQYSTDGGKTWTKSYQIWPDLISQTHSQATGVDSDGNLYWADVLRFPNGAYLIRWDGSKWQQPELFYMIQPSATEMLNNRINTHHLRMAISRGNELYVVFQDQDRAEVWVMHKPLPSRSIPVQPVPTSTASGLPTAIATPQAINQNISVLRTALPPSAANLEPVDLSEGPGPMILAGVLPVLMIISILALKASKRP